MKRVASYTKQLAKLEQKRSKINAKLDRATNKIITKEKEKATKGRAAFISNMKITRVFRDPVPILNAGDMDVEARTLMDILYLPEMAESILRHMGPMELYLTTRVSRAFLEYTKKAFLSLAPHFMARYGEDIEASRAIPSMAKKVGDYDNDVKIHTKSVELMKNGRSSHSIGKMLSCFHSLFVRSRQYQMDRSERVANKEVFHTNWAFTYDTETKTYAALSDLNLFRMSKYDDALSALNARWKKKNYSFQVADEDKLRYFNHKELIRMKFTPVKSGFSVTKDTVSIKGDEICRLSGSSQLFGITRIGQHIRDSKDIGVPFLDHYELRLALDKRRAIRAIGGREPRGYYNNLDTDSDSESDTDSDSDSELDHFFPVRNPFF